MEAETGCDDGVAGIKMISLLGHISRGNSVSLFLQYIYCKVLCSFQELLKFMISLWAPQSTSCFWKYGYYSVPIVRPRNYAQSLSDLSKLVKKELDLDFFLFWFNPWSPSKITPYLSLLFMYQTVLWRYEYMPSILPAWQIPQEIKIASYSNSLPSWHIISFSLVFEFA